MDATIEKHFIDALGVNDSELIQGLFDEYCQLLINSLAEMTVMLQNGDYAQIKAVGYKIKGAALAVGHPAMSQTAIDLEKAALNADKNACQAGLEQVKNYLALHNIPSKNESETF